MSPEPTAIVQPAPLESEEASFRRELREFMRDTKIELRHMKAAIDLLLKAEGLDRG